MGNELQNVAALREAYARWHESKGGSIDHWMALLADNISFGSVAGGSFEALPFATFYDSRAELRGYFEGLLREWDMQYFTAQEFIAQDDNVVMRGATSWRNRKTGKIFATPKVDVWRFRNGKAIEFYEFFDTAGALRAAEPASPDEDAHS